MMRAVYLVVRLCVLAAATVGARELLAQDYPSKPVRIITTGAGDGNDLQSRLIAQEISGPLGQPVIVENRGGGVGIEIVAKSPADGYTVLLYGAPIWLAPLLRETPWDPVRDFSPVTLGATVPNILAVHPSLPVKSVKDLIAVAKSKPGELNYSTGSTGSSSHLSGELFNAMAGTKLVRVPYKTGATEMADLISGYVQLTFGSYGQIAPTVKAGKLRGLAVTSAKQSELMPELPTVAASGLPGYEVVSLSGIFVPAKTPTAIINRLNQEIVRALNKPEVKAKLLTAGVQTVGGTPGELANVMNAEITKWRKLIKDAGIKAD